MDSKTSKPETPPIGIESQHDEEDDEAGRPCDSSQRPTKDEPESGPGDSQTNENLDTTKRPKGIKFALLLTCIFLVAFFIGYDTSCIATLNPVITDQFHALDDLGWFTIVYLLAQSATMSVYGQLYSSFSMKTLFMASLVVFTGGSVLSAAAPTAPSFIVGRALSGLAAAGLLAGMNIIIAHTTSLKRRPIYSSIIGAVECAAIAFGPFISGTIAQYSTWRVSFYIIIPVSVAITVLVFFSVEHMRHSDNSHGSGKDKLKRIDWVGFLINIPMTLCFILALQWARTVYPWADWRIILLLALTAVLSAFFLFVEYRAGDNSMVPLKMLRQRSVACASLITFCNFSHLSVLAYYLPLYFQAVRGAGTFRSGLMYLPQAATIAIMALVGGPLITKAGYYNPTLIIGSIFSIVGAGLITTFGPDTSPGRWISYQIIYGLGIGLAFQPPYVAVQTVLDDSIVPTALVLLSFTQQLGGIVMLSIAQNVFLNRLTHNLTIEAPQLDPDAISNHGALGLISAVPAAARDQVVLAYSKALSDVFYIALGLTGVVVLSALGVEWKSIKKEKNAETPNVVHDPSPGT